MIALAAAFVLSVAGVLRLRLHSAIRDAQALCPSTDWGTQFKIEFWTGDPPVAMGGSEGSNVLIATLVVPNPALQVVAGTGTLSLTGTWTITAAAVSALPIKHVVIRRNDGSGGVRADATVSDMAGNGDFRVSNQIATFVGQQITVNVFNLLMGAAA